MLDDPIKALDNILRRKVFDQVINGLLKDKTRILVTNAVEFIPHADKLVIMEEGKITGFGTPHELKDH